MGPEFDDYNDGSANGTAGEIEDIDNTTYENEEEYEKRYEEEYTNEPDKEQSSSTDDSFFSSNKRTKEAEQEQTNEETGEGEKNPSKIKSFLKKIFTAENIWSALLVPFMFINAAVRAIIFGDSLTGKQLNMKDVADKRKTAKDIDNKSKRKTGEQQQKDETDPKQETEQEAEQETEQKKTRDKATTDRMNSACMRIFGQGIGKLNIAKELDLNMSADEREVNGHKVIKIGNDKIAVVKANIRDLEKKIFSSVFKVDNNIYSKVKMELDVTPPARGKVKMPVEKDMQAYVSAAIKSCMIGCALKRALGEGENPSVAYCDVSLADTKDGSVHICADFDEKKGIMEFYVENDDVRYKLGEIPADALVNGDPNIHLGVFAKQLCEELYSRGNSKDLRMIMDQAKAVNKRVGRSFENDARENRETDKTEPRREREPEAEPKSEPKTESRTEEKTAEGNESKEARQETSKSEKTKEPEREQRKEGKERNKGIFSKARDMMEERSAKKETKKFLEEYSKLSYVSETITNLSPRALEMITDAAVTGNIKNSTELLSYVVKMPGATQYVYDKAVAFSDPYVNAQMANSSMTPQGVLDALVHDERAVKSTPDLQKVIARNPNTSTETLDSMAEINHAASVSFEVAREIAKNPNTSTETLDKLATDKRYIKDIASRDIKDHCLGREQDNQVVAAAVSNPHISPEVITKVVEEYIQKFKDLDPKQHSYVEDMGRVENVLSEVASNPSISPDMMNDLRDLHGVNIDFSLMRNPNTPSEMLAEYYKEAKDISQRECIARNPNCPSELKEASAKEVDGFMHPENYEKEQTYIYKDPVSEKEKMEEKIDLSSLAKACNEENRTSKEIEKEEFSISDFAVNEEELRDTENAVFDPEIIGSKSEMEEYREIESDERDMDEETL